MWSNKYTVMNDIIYEYKDSIPYSDEVLYAVRYGYQYRKEAEEAEKICYCLPEASSVLLWLGGVILGGATWDIIKAVATKTYNKLFQKGENLDEETAKVLRNEEELLVFYEYVVEFHERRMTVTEDQLKYIKEEIFADFSAQKESEIYEKKERLATIEERKIIYREAISFVDSLTKQ
jgi:phosphomevalonate kinase